MTRTADQIRKGELAQIHIAKTQLGLDEDTYRAMLWSFGRVKSAKDLDWRGRKAVLDHLKACGFKAQKKTPKGQNRHDWLIWELWKRLAAAGLVQDGSEKAMLSWVRRQTGVERLEWLSSQQSTRVVEALKAWVGRATASETASGAKDGPAAAA